MGAIVLVNAPSNTRAGRKPQTARARVLPHARRFQLQRPLCGPSINIMALRPFDSLLDQRPAHLLETEESMGLERARTMAVDFVEDRNGFEIKADIPGVLKKDIKLDVDRNVITISAKQTSKTGDNPQKAAPESEEDLEVVDNNSIEDSVHDSEAKVQKPDARMLRYERFESFQSRSFQVPKTADLSTISAKYENGVLTVDIKKRQDVLDQKRTIDIV